MHRMAARSRAKLRRHLNQPIVTEYVLSLFLDRRSASLGDEHTALNILYSLVVLSLFLLRFTVDFAQIL